MVPENVPVNFLNDLLDHLIRPREHRLRDCQAERLRSLEVDHQIEPGGLLDGEVAGLRPLEDLVDIDGRALVVLGLIGP